MSSDAILDRISTFFKEEQFETQLFRQSSEFPTPYVNVDLGNDHKARERILRVSVREQKIKSPFLEGDKGYDNALYHIEFELEYPFDFTPIATKDLASLLHFLNNQTRMTIFCMDEVDLDIFLRYDIFAAEDGIDKKLFMAITSVIILLYDLYVETIEAVAKGTTTFNEVIEKLINMDTLLKQLNDND